MRIFVIRHGESLATRDRTLFSRMDPEQIPLTQWGYEQAVDAGNALADFYARDGKQPSKIHVYYSPLVRTAQSKDGVLQGLQKCGSATQIEETADHGLGEQMHGRFDGKTLLEQELIDPIAFHHMHHGSSEERFKTCPPEGESLEMVQQRLQKFMQRVRAENSPDTDIVLVTHGGNCRAIEDMLSNYNASWLVQTHPPGTGDVQLIETNFEKPVDAVTIHSGKTRPIHLPHDYKAVAQGELALS